MSDKRLIHLATQLLDNADGREFLALLKELHILTPTFPIDEHKMQRHGGPLGWASFREGNLDMLRKLELMSKSRDYLNETKEEKK